MFMDDAVMAMAPRSAAERALLAELEANARCTCGGEDRPSVHEFPPCAARLIKHLHIEIVSLQVLAEEALTDADAQPAEVGMASRVAGPNGASVYVPDWTDAVGEVLLSATIDSGDQIDRAWLVKKWLTDHPEDDTSRGVDSRGQSQGRVGTYRVGRALKSLHELGIVVRAQRTVTVDRSALAAFLEQRRLSEDQPSRSLPG